MASSHHHSTGIRPARPLAACQVGITVPDDRPWSRLEGELQAPGRGIFQVLHQVLQPQLVEDRRGLQARSQESYDKHDVVPVDGVVDEPPDTPHEPRGLLLAQEIRGLPQSWASILHRRGRDRLRLDEPQVLDTLPSLSLIHI